MNKFNNILIASFVAANTVESQERKTVMFNKKATFSINGVTAKILGDSIHNYVENITAEQVLPAYDRTVKSIPVADFLVTLKLQRIIAEGPLLIPENYNPDTDEPLATTDVELTRDEVIVIKGYVEGMMLSEEKLRDARSDEFNADSYITLKYFLLDIREWLCGSIID